MPRANPASFREAASRFTTGVAVLTALDEHGRVCGMTANSFVTVSLSPPTVLVSVMPGRMHRAISATGRYCVNVLPEHGRDLSRHFASQPNTGATPDYVIVDGLPRLSGLHGLVRLRGHTPRRCQRPHADHRRSFELRLSRHYAAGVLLEPVSSRAGRAGGSVRVAAVRGLSGSGVFLAASGRFGVTAGTSLPWRSLREGAYR
ncbi:hypothetical protein ACVW0J_001905 [Bradyrhizobium sp. i1.7.7]